jgi:hypothetical protein
MDGAPDAGRCHVDLVGIRLGIGDEFRNCPRGKSRIDDHDEWRSVDARDWHDVAEEVEMEVRVKRRIDCICRSRQEQCVTVGGRIHDGLSGYGAAGARTVLNDELLTKPLRQPLPH